MTRLFTAAAAAALFAVFANAQHDGVEGKQAHKSTSDILTTAADAKQFTTLIKAIEAAGLEGALKGKGPFTVFAPTDAAFAKIPADKLAALMLPSGKEQLKAILTYHVVSGDMSAQKIVKQTELESLSGSMVTVDTKDGVKVGGSKVVKTDIAASNGTIHVLDTVMMPPAPMPDLVDTAVKAGTFKTLATALKAADLVGALRGKGPFTVFAPNDAAFAKLDPKTLESLLLPENQQKLAGILKYHVVAGRVMAAQALKLDSAETLQGGKLELKVREGKLYVNGAQVIATDVLAGNGVIHVIDTVVLPR